MVSITVVMEIMVIMIRQNKLRFLLLTLALAVVLAFTVSTSSYAYTEEEKAQAKAWLSAHGYSPDAGGAAAAYQDYLNGKFDEELGINRSTTEEKAEPPKDIKEKFPAAVSGIINDSVDGDDAATVDSTSQDAAIQEKEEVTTEVTTEVATESSEETTADETEETEEKTEVETEINDTDSVEEESSFSQIILIAALVIMLGVLGFAGFYLLKGKE